MTNNIKTKINNNNGENKMNITFRGNKKINTTKVVVKSIGWSFKSHKQYQPRFETIDLINNELFEDCKTEFDIEDVYELFWNRLNTIEVNWKPKEIVKVIKVYPYRDFQEMKRNKTKKIWMKVHNLYRNIISGGTKI